MNRSLCLAQEIIQKLKDNGYVAYIVGGWVRDFLLGIPSDDIDIATNAIPSEINQAIERFGENQEAIVQFGIDYATRQCRELLEAGVPGLHFYTLNKSTSALKIFADLQSGNPKS